ncbi:hypothetical protein [Kutzneria chonburiensis]|uniref:Ricin B lectin domain-containing protein n=1 Tax=Kutzneria chonburiensis TaxID=1483604 RepID=A0ABV6MJ99_9PSEU|nr:hypothetical protein [Kutzneria chonburiensis]
MGRTTWGLLSAAVVAAGLVATPAVASAAPAGGGVMIQNGAFNDQVLCASPTNQSTWLQSKGAAAGNSYCQWMQIGGDDRFGLINLGKLQVMACSGGDVQPIVMEPSNSSPLGGNAELFSWGGWEDWGYRALQCFYDSGQNVDAKSPNGDTPRTDPVRARGWRHGYQRELTWNEVPAN